MQDFHRACAAVDVWLHGVKALCADRTQPETADWPQQLFSAIEKLKFAFLAGPPRSLRVESPQDFPKALEQLAGHYENIEPKALVKQWWKQAQLFRWANENDPARTQQDSAGDEADHDLKERCLHYAEVLKVRSDVSSKGGLVTKGLIKLINRRDTNRVLDHEIADLLEEVADTLSDSSASTNGQAVASSWLFDPSAAFSRKIFWPVPALARFQTAAEETSAQPVKPPVIGVNNSDLITISRTLVFWGLKSYSHLNEALLELWIDLVKQHLGSTEKNAGEELRILVSKLYARDDFWRNTPPKDWELRCLQKTAELLEPEIQLIPGLSDQGRLEVETLGLKELQLVNTLPDELRKQVGPQASVVFGIKGQIPAMWAWLNLDEDQQYHWEEWQQTCLLEDRLLEERFLIQRKKLCAGEELETLKAAVYDLLSMPQGDDWLHRLVEQTVRSPAQKLGPLNALLQSARMNVYPPLNGQGEPVWHDSLQHAEHAELVEDSLQGSAEHHTIIRVERFASRAANCRLTYTRPVDRRFGALAEAVHRYQHELDAELLQQLDAFYRLVVAHTDQDSRRIAKAFLAVINHLRDQTLQKLLSKEAAEQLWKESRSVCKALMPSIELLDSPDKEGVDLEYRYDSQKPRGKLLQIIEFGVRVGEEIFKTAKFVISAGPAPENYEATLPLLSEVEPLLGKDLGEMIRDLPRLETIEEKPEKLFTDMFRLLWPWEASRADVIQWNADPNIQKLRRWYEETVLGRGVLAVITSKPGDSVVNQDWELNRMYIEANKDKYPDPRRVDLVARPLLVLYHNREMQKIVKEKAVFYVKE